LKKYPTVFDGLDIDLELPCLPGDTACGNGITPSNNDRDAYTALVSAFR